MPERNATARWTFSIYLGLAIITFALYLPSLGNGFIEYDDQQYVTENPRVQAGLTWSGFIWAFGFHAGNWHPLAWLSHMLDCQLFGARAWGHHLTSVLVHTATTLLIFAVLKRLTGFVWRSAAVAAIFAWHPLHVESVAWVAERKDVLCAFFWMLTLWFYVKREACSGVREANAPRITHHKSRYYILALTAFALALMSKPMAVTLPFVLLLLDYWPLNRISSCKLPISNWWPLVREKMPFFALSGLACWLTVKAQTHAIVSTAGLPLSERIVHTLVAYGHYIFATFWPTGLAICYPYVQHLPLANVILAIIVLLGTTALAVAKIRSQPFFIIGWLWFLGTLVPVIGLVQVGDQAWADRYTYLPMIGLSIIFVWTVAAWFKNQNLLRSAAGSLAVLMLGLSTWQLRYWKDTRTLFAHANQATQGNYLALTILGSVLAKEHKLDEAKTFYFRALQLKPTFPEAHFFLGDALDEAGLLDEAIAEYQQALWFRPTQEQTHIFLGIAYGKQKKYAEAIEHYEAALKLNPDSAVTHNNLARIFHTQGRYDEAIQHYQAALEIDPKLALAHNNLGILLLQKNDLAGGILQLRTARQLNPTNAETTLNLAFALNQQQQWPAAAELFAQVMQNDLPDPRAHYEFGSALARTGKIREATAQFACALLQQPDYPDALDALAWILATAPDPTLRNGIQAVNLASQACLLTRQQDPAKLKTLAAAQAETGQFADASQTIAAASQLAAQRKLEKLAAECAALQATFQQSNAWHQP